MPEVVTKGYKLVIIGYGFEILITDKYFMKGVKYSMTGSRIRSVSAIMLVLMLTITSAFGVNAAAKSPEYSASNSYKSSIYYKNLTAVELTGDQVTDIVNIAKSQVGYHEGSLSGNSGGSSNYTEYGRWYGSQGAWCNKFVSWCASVAGIPSSVFPTLTSSSSGYSILRSAGAECFSYSSSKELQPGDIIFVNSRGGYSGINHVGLVVSADDTTIYTVEGNMSDAVKSITYSRSSGYSSYYHARITCVARPNYENNSQDADVSEASNILSYGNTLYSLFDSSVCYSEAKAVCEAMGGRLAEIENDEELSEIAKIAAEGDLGRYYIGYDYNNEDADYSVINSDGTVNETYANKSRTGFICEINIDDIKASNAASFNGSKYEIYDISMTYEQAKAFAEAKGGSLAVIDSENTAMMLSLLLKDSESYYTGTFGSEDELKNVFDSFTEETVFGDNNIAVLLNDGSRRLSVSEGYGKESKAGFVVEYGESEKCTVIYDANGGENAPIEKIAEKGENVSVTDVEPVKGKKDFIGWAYSDDAKTVDVSSGEEIILKENITLYAVWG